MSAVQPTLCPKLTHSVNLTSFSLQLHRFTAGRSVRGEHAWSSDSGTMHFDSLEEERRHRAQVRVVRPLCPHRAPLCVNQHSY